MIKKINKVILLLLILFIFTIILIYYLYKFNLKLEKFVNINNNEYGVIHAFTDNIGDDIQTLAAIQFLKKKGITNYDFIDRETLDTYSEKPITVIMNGWFLHDWGNFPPSKNIHPIFISIHIAHDIIIKNNIEYFKTYQPIGCRDIATVNKFKEYGIDAYFSGCLTLLLNESESIKYKDDYHKKYLVDIHKDWQPDIGNVIMNIDLEKYKDFEKIEAQNIISTDIFYNINKRLELATSLLEKYKSAELIITSRLHCILPCRSFGTNSIFIHNDYYNNKRFSGFHEVINGDNKLHNKMQGNNETIYKIKESLLNTNINNSNNNNIIENFNNDNIIEILEPKINDNTIIYFFMYKGKEFSYETKFISNEKFNNGIESVVTILLPFSILNNITLYSKVHCDKKFINNLYNILPVFKKMNKNNNLKLNIDIPLKENTIKQNKRVVSSFTLGVDSFYTLYSNIDKIDCLLFVIGFDIKNKQTELLNETIKNLEIICKMYNKKLILCDTTLKNKIYLDDKGFDWGKFFHGPAIFSIIHSLDNNYNYEFIIPSSPGWDGNAFLWGSHPLLDKHYGSNNLTIIHDDKLTRVQKIKFMIDYDDKCLKYLRVCYMNFHNNKYNCTNCAKCFFTLYSIKLHGYMDKAITFDRNIDIKSKFWSIKDSNLINQHKDEIIKLENN